MNAFWEWLDDRTGIREVVGSALYERVPGGARWRYVTGSMLVLAFVTQVVTGLVLWAAYSPGTQNAWESVYFIQFEMTGGWFLRGLHHSMAQAMVVLLPVHLLQVIIDRAYVAPREFNYWFGLILMLIVLALGLTGYLLPWDQKGFWATKVATTLMGLAPGGEYLQKVVVGGSDYGQHTLTRFFALHAGVLPGLLVLFLVVHLALFRRHGITAYRPNEGEDQFFWPHQVLKDSVAFLVLLVVICVSVYQESGAELGAPADATESYNAARPEWYFLFLFQLLKKFKSEFVGAIVVPGVLFAFLFLMPLWGRARVGHFVNVVVILLLILGAGYLTCEAMYEDRYAEWFDQPTAESPAETQQLFTDSMGYLHAVEDGEREAHRAQELAAFYGIPRAGMLSLIREDPETIGPRIFRRACASCHSYDGGEDSQDVRIETGDLGDGEGAPNLYGIGSRAWLTGILDPEKVVSNDYFGNCAQGQKDEDGAYPGGGMVEYVQDNLAELDNATKRMLSDLVAAVSAQAKLVRQRQQDQEALADGSIERGTQAVVETFACTDCHKFGEEGDLGMAPDLTGWGSEDWLIGMIRNPEHERFYEVSNDRMPAFGQHEDESKNQLSDAEIRLLARWLRQDDKHLAPGLPVSEPAE